ncbi:MAG TPA: cellulase family glycosylhydrolase [Candidatus Saccharimonadales bacterium]|nr:cellulase family glycosylhydrolase [Candidatus Saccharimonadales bacterium]
MNVPGIHRVSAAFSHASSFLKANKLIVTIVAFALIGGGYLTFAFASTTTPPTIDHCAKAKGPFTVHGTTVMQDNGQPYIPYGITVPGLAQGDYSAQTISTDESQIQAAANDWCSNTVRLQVSQDSLVGVSGTVYSKPFMDAIKAEVSYAENLGLVVVINAQTEVVGNEPLPTIATHAFWKSLTGVYGSDPQVVFDLFNEPHTSIGGNTQNDIWEIWQNGGVRQNVTYLGMQQLATDVRSFGAKNLFWIEGPNTASTLSEVTSYPITNVGPMVYAIHHPKGTHNVITWQSDFGYLITQHVAPVVVGEWTQYASATQSECWSDAYTAVPSFLNYLQNLHIGMTVWSLRQGVMLKSSDFSQPTHIDLNYKCVDNINGPNGPNEGAGRQVRNWFTSQNSGATLSSQ